MPKAQSEKRKDPEGTLVRINRKDKDILQELANREGEPMPKILHKALEVYRRYRFLDEVNSAFTILKSDSQAWDKDRTEQVLWQAVEIKESR